MAALGCVLACAVAVGASGCDAGAAGSPHGRTDVSSAPPAGSGAQLILPPGPPAGWVELQQPARPGEPMVHGSYVVCLDRPGNVKVTSVGFASGDIDVTGWALRPNPGPLGKEYAGDWGGETLASRDIANTDVLTAECDEKASGYEVVMQLRAGKVSTQGKGVLVRYTSDGSEGSLTIPDRVVLCVRPEMPNCM